MQTVTILACFVHRYIYINIYMYTYISMVLYIISTNKVKKKKVFPSHVRSVGDVFPVQMLR